MTESPPTDVRTLLARFTRGLPFTALCFCALVLPQQGAAQQPSSVSAPDGASVWYERGLAALKASDFAAADAAFRKVVELEPAALRGYLGVAQVYTARKLPDDGIRYLQTESAKQPARADLRLALGDGAVRAGQYDLALAAFRGALAPEGEKLSPELLVPRGPGEDGAGTTAAGSSSTPPPGAAEIHLRLAQTLQLKHDAPGAAAEWRKVAELVPKNAVVLTSLGMQLEAAGQKADAIATYREALALAPSNPIILNNLAFLIADTGGDLYEALRFARRAANFAPGNLSVMDTEAWVALKQGSVDDALGTLLKVVERDPMNSEYRKHLAEAITKRAVRSAASDELMKALNRPPVPGDEEIVRSLLQNLVSEKAANRR